jgi:aminoglycoside phosphotransferase (APT) family kinase protein
VTIENASRLSGGASRETWTFDAAWDAAGAERLEGILRADPVVGAQSMPGRELEYTSIKAAWDAGAVVPEPLWDGDGTFPVHFFVMRRVPGEAIGSRLIRGEQYAQAREDLPQQLATSMARIHTVKLADYPALGRLPAPKPGVSPAQAELERYEANFRASSPDPHPVFELALRWMWANLPQVDEQTFVHGDLRLGNFMFEKTDCAASSTGSWRTGRPHGGHRLADCPLVALRWETAGGRHLRARALLAAV